MLNVYQVTLRVVYYNLKSKSQGGLYPNTSSFIENIVSTDVEAAIASFRSRIKDKVQDSHKQTFANRNQEVETHIVATTVVDATKVLGNVVGEAI